MLHPALDDGVDGVGMAGRFFFDGERFGTKSSEWISGSKRVGFFASDPETFVADSRHRSASAGLQAFEQRSPTHGDRHSTAIGYGHNGVFRDGDHGEEGVG